MSAALTPPDQASLLLQAGFILLTALMSAGFVWWTGLWRSTLLWLSATGLVALGGFYTSFDPPPLLLTLVPALIYITRRAWRSDWHHKPLALIVGYQAFRIPVELLIKLAVDEGIAPPQFTWTGMNYDVVTGIVALSLFPFAARLPKWSLHAVNALGFGLLLNIMVVAVLSMPSPLQQIRPDNVWVGYFPFHWLPLVHVILAWTGHVVLLKACLSNDRQPV